MRIVSYTDGSVVQPFIQAKASSRLGPGSSMLDRDFADKFAADWLAAWNRHDLDQVLTHYSDNFSLSSPYIVEIAGNENIFVTAIKLNGSDFAPPPETSIIGEIARDGYDDHRLLLSVPIIKLADLIRKLETGPVKLEHIYDY